MSNYEQRFKASKSFKQEKYPTDISAEINPEWAKEELKKIRKKLAKIQDMMYAHNRYNVLICFQGMDTAGKDSLIRELFKEFNARGVEVNSFKTPTSLELQHDFLWRHYIKLPAKGKFGVFNRTHYENVLVTRVHPEYLLHENLPGIEEVKDIPKTFWKDRFTQINNFEKLLTEGKMIVLKFYLHLSKEEQKTRLLRRLDKGEHNWKFSPADLAERKLWDRYMDCYEEAIQQTSKPHAPWHIIPADNKDVARYLVAKILLEKLSKYKDIDYPELDESIQEQLKHYRKELEKD
ncbi:PPK2 family polyphosphate kinase [Sphingobacterium bambusae]|uniref:PPK2 family polyphosphate kinase n=1 Tax=Sphingobacterium bambusae TaxID=662858 RepID=A0ABW6BGT6_9SPHI|nr:PPK2 family polyphosphate kinase [Sphingobacterium bambusae]WPL49834.1 polyphosphate kinase 2 family protein [Sphingobacterium bambusae]